MALPPFLVGDDLLKFRTRHCQRFVKQGFCNFGDKCQYSHNIEWTRRPLWKYNYTPQLCHFVYNVQPDGKTKKLQHSCCLHRQCPFAHSYEEQIYHPKVYKRISCERFIRNECYRYYCPFAHGTVDLQGEQHVDADLLKLMSIPQDVLCPLDVSSIRTPSVTSDTFQYKESTHNDEASLSRPIFSLTKLSSEEEIISSEKDIQNKLSYPTDPLSLSSILPSFFTPLQETILSRNIEHDGLQSLNNLSPKLLGRELYFSIENPERSQGLVHLTSNIYYNPTQLKFRETCFPLDSELKPFTLTCFEGIAHLTTPNNICVLQITSQDHDILLHAYAKLQKFYHCKLAFIYNVTFRIPPSHSNDNCKACQDAGLWVACLASSFINIPPKDAPLENFKGFLDEKSYRDMLIKIEIFFQDIAVLHASGISHGRITPWSLEKHSIIYKAYLGHTVYNALPLSVNQLNMTYLLYQSSEVLKAILSRKQSLIEKSQTIAADVWSCGICIFVWLSKNYAHPHGDSVEKIFYSIVDEQQSQPEADWKKEAPLLHHLIRCMVHSNPLKRISLQQALSHPVFWMLRTRDFYFSLLHSTLSVTAMCCVPEPLDDSIHWVDKLFSHSEFRSHENVFIKLTQFTGHNHQQMLFFVHQAIQQFNDELDSVSLLPQHDIEPRIVRSIYQQSTLGLFYFICLLYVQKSPLDDLQEVVLFFCQLYAEPMIELQSFLWRSSSKSSTDLNLQKLRMLATDLKNISSLDYWNTEPNTNSTINGLSNEASDRNLYIPIKPSLQRSTSTLPEDILDGESTTASSSCPHFVQSLLSFMSDEL